MWRGLWADSQCSEEGSSWIGAWDLSMRWRQSGTIPRRVKQHSEGQAITGHLILHQVLSFPQQYTLHCSNFRHNSNKHKCKCYHVYETLIYTILCCMYLLHAKPIFPIKVLILSIMVSPPMGLFRNIILTHSKDLLSNFEPQPGRSYTRNAVDCPHRQLFYCTNSFL
jgi:hypothetical protein